MSGTQALPVWDSELAPAARVIRRAWLVLRPAGRRILTAHRRYTSGNGDALAGALTYALLVGSAPAVLLCSAALSALRLGPGLTGSNLLGDAHSLLPAEVVREVDGAGAGAVSLRLSVVVLLAWFALRLVRALRTAIRTMCGQQAGSGNPARDYLVDSRLGLELMLAATAVVTVAALTAGHWWSPLASIAAVWLLFTAIMLRASWPLPGRPSLAAALRASLVATLACALLAHAAHGYFTRTYALHAEIYQTAGTLIGVLVWCSLTARILLRATAWASTASAAKPHPPPVPLPEPRPGLWVVVPAFNEATGIRATLDALAGQTDLDFALVVVDNGSTDGTADVVRDFAATAPFAVEVIGEALRGPGPAADTGFRHAIGRGAAMLARTDADCVPAPDWVAAAKSALAEVEMACGRSVPRLDESPRFAERHLLPTVTRFAGLCGRYRPVHRDSKYLTPYVLCHGHNIALTADLYLRCGGTPRGQRPGPAEDLGLVNRAREHSRLVKRAEHMVVGHSLRRVRAWGPRRTLLWYAGRRYQPATASAMNVR